MVLLENKRQGAAAVATAILFPFASFLVYFRRRSRAFRNTLGMFLLCGVMFVAFGALSGCTTTQPATPAGTSEVTVTATSGSISQTATISLTVQ
jgi:apolipoprotein N-acyltransferase